MISITCKEFSWENIKSIIFLAPNQNQDAGNEKSGVNQMKSKVCSWTWLSNLFSKNEMNPAEVGENQEPTYGVTRIFFFFFF